MCVCVGRVGCLRKASTVVVVAERSSNAEGSFMMLMPRRGDADAYVSLGDGMGKEDDEELCVFCVWV